MSLAHPWTLTRYLIEERRRFPHAGGDLNAMLLDLSVACKAIARSAALGDLRDDAASGRTQATPAVALSRELPTRSACGKYLLLFDAPGGSGDAGLNATTGSLFSILRRPARPGDDGRDAVEADFLQPGRQQVAAGYALYGPATMLVLSVGNGVAGFTLDPALGEFMLTHPAIRVPEDTREYAIDAANSRFWGGAVRRYVDECQAGRTGLRHRDFSMRWIASGVADAHRILLRGGVCLQPRDGRERAPVRLLHEANPIAFLVEQAGGRASTGRRAVLDVEPTAFDQRVGLVFGSRSEVERIERYHHEPADTDRGDPLFADRGLFRA